VCVYVCVCVCVYVCVCCAVYDLSIKATRKYDDGYPGLAIKMLDKALELAGDENKLVKAQLQLTRGVGECFSRFQRVYIFLLCVVCLF
jgi:hypothetical protein